jgi:predicted Fe-Mo cluster-binding NifX family protein
MTAVYSNTSIVTTMTFKRHYDNFQGASSSDTVGTTAKALRVANVLRAHGTRIAVAEKNIGYPQYSFNAIQRQFIPELYRAPLQTIQDVLTSFQKRDS